LKAAETTNLPSNLGDIEARQTELHPFREITEFVSTKEEIVQVVLRQINSAKEEILGIGSKDAPNLIASFQPYKKAVSEAIKRVKLPGRYITDVVESNLESCKYLINDLHVKVRHLKDIRSNLVITEKEFTSDLSSPHPEHLTTKLLYSNSIELLIQQKQLFETLWSISIPAEQRIKEIEEGEEPEETRLLTQTPETREVSEAFTQISKLTKNEALVFLPTLERLDLRNPAFQILAEKAVKGRIPVRILAPLTTDQEVWQRIMNQFPAFEIRKYEPIHIGLIISDRKRMLFIQYLDIESTDLGNAIASGIYSTHKETISSIVSIYETMWASSRVREKEAKSRKQAELLQDILTHDIRNYNQVAKLSAELLKEELKDNLAVQSIVESMLEAVDGSTRLLERAKKLGRVISDENPVLYSVDLKKIIRSSLDLVKMSFSEKAITYVERYSRDQSSINVLADELVGEVFTNVFSNSIVHTKSNLVKIEIDVKESEQRTPGTPETASSHTSLGQSYWIVSISDQGKGITDTMKSKLFSRYLESAKGSGLGMSIVHALVVERYKGAVNILDRVPGDYSKGTTVEIWLPKA
jgi:signal transduction histidine kinase